MIKSLTTIGNSKAVILPKRLVDKYQLDQVSIQEVAQGILITSASKNSFQYKLDLLREKKDQIYQRMRKQAEKPEVIAYYKAEALPDDIDLDIEER